MKRVILKDVAEHSGYSLRTVKKALGGKEYVSDEVRKEILNVANKLNYRTNKIASILAKNQEFRIALVYANMSKYYFPEVEKGFARCAEEFRDYGITVEYFKKDDISSEWQKDLLKQIAGNDNIHGVVLEPTSIDSLDEEIALIAEKGKPVATFGTDAPQSKRLCYIGPNAYKSGRIAAELMANYIGKKGKVFIISQSKELMQTTERARGFKDKLKEEYQEISIEEILIPANKKVYYDSIKSLILNENGINGLFSTDADVYLAANVLKDLDKKDEIVLMGYDTSEETTRFLMEGYIKVVFYQNPEFQGYMSLKVLCEYFLDRRLPKNHIVDVGVSIITKEFL